MRHVVQDSPARIGTCAETAHAGVFAFELRGSGAQRPHDFRGHVVTTIAAAVLGARQIEERRGAIDDDVSRVARRGDGTFAMALLDFQTQLQEPRYLLLQARSFVLALAPFGRALRGFGLTAPVVHWLLGLAFSVFQPKGSGARVQDPSSFLALGARGRREPVAGQRR
jgi:hypothetical protein